MAPPRVRVLRHRLGRGHRLPVTVPIALSIRRMLRAVFGGSFDPVHNGHLVVAAAARDALGAGLVHFVPACIQPFKAGRHAAAAADRVAMLELALAGEPSFVVDTTEIARGGVSYTVDTLRGMRARYPEDALSLLVGADAAQELDAWHEAAAMPALASVVVLTRPGAPRPSSALVSRVLDVPLVPVSAREVRARVVRGEAIGDLVPPPVAAYIKDHDLYRRE